MDDTQGPTLLRTFEGIASKPVRVFDLRALSGRLESFIRQTDFLTIEKHLASAAGNAWHLWRIGRAILISIGLSISALLLVGNGADFVESNGLVVSYFVLGFISAPVWPLWKGCRFCWPFFGFRRRCRLLNVDARAVMAAYLKAMATIPWRFPTRWNTRLKFAASMVLTVLFIGAFVIARKHFPFLLRLSKEGKLIAAVVIFLSMFGCNWLIAQIGRRVTGTLAPSLEELRKRDARPSILYLRAFLDDDVTVGTNLPLTWKLEPRFEEALCNSLFSIGPVGAIGRPGEILPKTGAAREYVIDDPYSPNRELWKQRVITRAHEAGTIVLLWSETQGLEWEATMLRQNGMLQNTYFVVPPFGAKLSVVGRRERIKRLLSLFERHGVASDTQHTLSRTDRDLLESTVLLRDTGNALELFAVHRSVEEAYRLALVFAEDSRYGRNEFSQK